MISVELNINLVKQAQKLVSHKLYVIKRGKWRADKNGGDGKKMRGKERRKRERGKTNGEGEKKKNQECIQE